MINRYIRQTCQKLLIIQFEESDDEENNKNSTSTLI